MIARRTAVAGGVLCALLAIGCGEPDWKEAREPVWATDYGGSIEPDIALQYDAPMRTIYDAPPDLALRRDSAVQHGTPADSVRNRVPADSLGAVTTLPDTTRARLR